MRKLLCSVAAIVAAGVGVQAKAAITYKFYGDLSSFEYIQDDVIDTNLAIEPSDLHSCNPSCTGVNINFDAGTIGVSYMTASGFGGGESASFYSSDVFSQLGDHFSRGRAGPRLNVAVLPEPASWAMMIAGFGAIGASLRTRSRKIRFA